MTTRLLLSMLPIGAIAMAQDNTFQLALNSPGNNTFMQYADGVVYDDGATAMLTKKPLDNTNGEAMVTKLAADGSILWSRHLEAVNQTFDMDATRVVATSDGGAAVFGIINGYEYFIARLDGNGEQLWSRLFLPSYEAGGEYGYSTVHALPDGGLIVNLGQSTYPTFMRLAADGTILWSRSYITDDLDTLKNPTFDFGLTSDGGMIITEKANEDMFLIRSDGDGQVQWSHRFTANYYTHTKTARELPNGEILVAGHCNYQPFAARLTSTGTLLWMRLYDVELNGDGFQRIIPLNNGQFLLSERGQTFWNGSLPSTEVGVRIDGDGHPLGLFTVASGVVNAGLEFIGDRNGMIYLAGAGSLGGNGGERYNMLCKVDLELDGACNLQMSSEDITDTDIASSVTTSDGCIAEDRIIGTWTMNMQVSNVVFTSQDLCAMITGIAVADEMATLNVSPTVAEAGEPVHVELTRNTSGRLELIGPDGRRIRSYELGGKAALEIRTSGLGVGPYVIRLLDHAGLPVQAARIIVQ